MCCFPSSNVYNAEVSQTEDIVRYLKKTSPYKMPFIAELQAALMNSDTNFSSSALVYQAWHYPQGLLTNGQAHPLLALYHFLGPSPNPSLKASLTIGSWTSRLPVRGFTPQNAPEVLSRAPLGILRPVRVQQSWLKTGRGRLCKLAKEWRG